MGGLDTAPAEPAPDPADEALTHLYAVHWRPLVRVAWLLLRDQQGAEDVVQDAFVAMRRRWPTLRDPDRALAYLRASVVNGVRSVQRHQVVVERRARSEAGRADLPDRAEVSSAETGALSRLRADALLTAVRALPARQREVLVLRYYADLSEAQIAQALGISPGSVKAHAHRALATLRHTVEER
ncbi:MAG: SigE family RNA polymerase sigma factor [Dermatophilaceae bacterium]